MKVEASKYFILFICLLVNTAVLANDAWQKNDTLIILPKDTISSKTFPIPFSSINDSTHKIVIPNTWKLYYSSLGKVLLSHAVSLGFLFSATKEKTNWDHDFGPELFRHVGSNLRTAWTKLPAWDKDSWETNYLRHPYAGSIYYNLVRNKNASVPVSFGYAVFGSTLFEYFTEAMFERPSVQDLLVTPIVGSLLGEGIHQLTVKMTRNGFNLVEKIFVLAFNPAYVFNHGFKVPAHLKKLPQHIEPVLLEKLEL